VKVILNIYKPKGITSFDIVYQLRKKSGIKKVGHAGTLDPLAEGVLVVLTGSDTKKQDEVLKTEKEYVAEIGFGICSETNDLEVIPEIANIPSLDYVKKVLPPVLNSFTGQIEQRVPLYSAVKVSGKPLYRRARSGKPVDTEQLPIKTVSIYTIEILRFENKEITTVEGVKQIPTVKLNVRCSHGTYIRSLARDIGEKIGSRGTLVSLVRTKVGIYMIDTAKRIEELEF
jgi:tRNA pseudouridine55 synthase